MAFSSVSKYVAHRSPSLRGSGLKYYRATLRRTVKRVSLFTREWIEIAATKAVAACAKGLPLYEGVD